MPGPLRHVVGRRTRIEPQRDSCMPQVVRPSGKGRIPQSSKPGSNSATAPAQRLNSTCAWAR